MNNSTASARRLLVAVLLLAPSLSPRLSAARSQPSVAHEQFRLKNGLHVILHPDRRLPKVVVNVLYRVGSRHEPPARSGVAHLFEHLMFMGTPRVGEGQLDLIMERAGGWNNAYTSEDVTDYYDVGPSRLLETLLWMEADRMASLPRALTQKKLDLQRKVVLNERRQSYENRPYGKAQLELPALSFPKGHPYSWPVIGSTRDLAAVTVGDCKSFFRRYYSPKNASLVIAGDFDSARAKALVRRYFSWIPAARAPSDSKRPGPTRLSAVKKKTVTDRVKLPRLYLAWHSPRYFSAGDAAMDLTASILAAGKLSRLHRSLVFERQIASKVTAYQDSRTLGSLFVVEVTLRPKAAPKKVEALALALLAEYAKNGPTQAEVDRAKRGMETSFLKRMQSLRRRAEMLNRYFALTGRPDNVAADLSRYRSLSRAAIHREAKTVLGAKGRVELWVKGQASTKKGAGK